MNRPLDWERFAEGAANFLIGLILAAVILLLIVTAIGRGGRNG